jgi:hypothetical protein
VKRLIQRTDMRNPDPGPSRFTSLAWAAVLACEEVFEFLLEANHDEEELSRVSNVLTYPSFGDLTSLYSNFYPLCRTLRTILF